MSYRTCVECSKMFRARSHRSRESKCWECEPRVKNTRMQQVKRDDNMTKDAYSRLEKLEKEIKDLRMEYDILQGEANRLVSDIQTVAFGLLAKAVEEEVERLFDDKIQLVSSIEARFESSLKGMYRKFSEKLEKAKVDIPTPVVVEKEVLPELSAKKKASLDRAVKYLKKAGPSTVADLVDTVWHDRSKSAARSLAKDGVLHKYLKQVNEGTRGRGKSAIYDAYETTLSEEQKDEMAGRYAESSPFTDADHESYYGDDAEDFA